MALLDRASNLVSAPDVTWLQRLDERIQRPPRRMKIQFDALAEDRGHQLGVDAYDALHSELTPRLGIYGVGLIRTAEATYLPAIFVMPEFLGIPTATDFIVSHAEPAVLSVLGVDDDDKPADVLTVALPPPVESYARVESGGQTGTLGMPVWLHDGSRGALTAGHVARLANVTVQIDGANGGTVRYTNHRALHRHPEATADVAAIEISAAVAIPPLAGVGDAVELGKVRALNLSGAGGDGQLVRTIHDRFAVDEQGAWADVVLVDEAISEPGDSGAVVVDEAGRAIGQIVGGHPPTYSIVQDAELLLTDAGATLRLE